MSNPYLAYVNTFNAAASGVISTNFTFSFVVSQFYAQVPVYEEVTGQVSIGGTVYTYRSTTAGALWETIGSPAAVFDGSYAAAISKTQRKVIDLDPGYYLIRVLTSTAGAGQFATLGVGTAMVLTAFA